MNFERCRRRFRKDKGGVSEVVGNILILMITVVLFSAIVMYVNEIPVPEMTTKADFSASISFYDDPVTLTTRATLTITHAGGVSLNAVNTAILLHIDSVTDYTKLSEDGNFTHEYWSMGIDWTKDFEVTSASSQIVAAVIDLDKKSTVWVSEVSGGAGLTPPIILQRYIDIDYVTPTPDVIPDGDDFYFFVKVIDLDNDLSDVWIDSSGVPGAGGDTVDEYENATATGWYRFDFIDVDDISAVDGAVIKIHAVDDLNHTTVSSYVISFINLPELPGSTTTGGDTPDDSSEGYPPWLVYGSGGQGYTLFGENTTSERADLDDARNNFTKDEVVFVRVVSRLMLNIDGRNSLQIMDTRNGFIYAPQYEGTLDSTVHRSTADRPFYFYSIYNQYSIYECQFSTVGLPPSNYALVINLASTGDKPYQFNPTVPMLLEETDSSITFTPAVWTYKYANETEEEWGLKTRPFHVSSADSSTIYVRVEVQDAVDVPAPSVDDIRIMDLIGNTQLHGTPPAPPMIEPWEANTDNPTNHTYVFSINLRMNNGDQWMGGTHAYVLKISRFSDQNEGIYSLTKMIFIRASSAKAEWLVGAAGYMTGTSNFVNPQYLYHVQNNNFFTKKVVYDYSNAPSAADNYATSAICLADIDGDGDKDILMGQYRSNQLYYVENSLTSYGSWQEAASITRPDADDDAVINCIAAGDINGDGDLDFAYSTLNEGSSVGRTIVIYNNTYGATGVLWSGSRYPNTLDGVRKIALEDMTGDGQADLIVLANGFVYVHDLTEEWTKTPYLARVPSTGDSANIQDFDIADVDRNGMLDILTVDTSTGGAYSAIQGVRVHYYSDKAPTVRTLTGSAVPLAGMVVDGNLGKTTLSDSDPLVVRENTTSESTYIGQLDLRMQFDTLTSDLDQQLKVRAKVSADATEGFYVWYSLVGSAGPYTPVMYIPSDTTDYEEFTVQLPSSVAGQAIYIKVTDTISSNASASTVEYLYLDYVAVLTDRHGGYVLNDKIASESLGYDCVRAANMNGCDTTTGDMGLEVAVAKDTGTHQWAVYNRTAVSTWSLLSGWGDSDATFYSRGSNMIDLHSSMNSDENYVKAILSKSSPRLFQVADVNGDGFSDIIVVNSTVNPDITSQVALFLNVYPCVLCEWKYYVVKDLAADFNTPDVTGGMTFLAVANLYTAESATL